MEPAAKKGIYRFPKRERLKKKAEIKAVFANRRQVSYTGSKLFFMKNGLEHNRIAITFTRKYGSAVERNRTRRVYREAYRLLRPSFRHGWDLVLLIYPGHDSDKKEMAARFRMLLSRAKVLI